MHIKELVPGTDDRMFIPGSTGSGKTTLIQKVVIQKHKQEKNTVIIILDTGNQWESQKITSLKYRKGIPIELTSKTNLNKLSPEWLWVYRPKFPSFSDPFLPKLFQWAYDFKQVCIVADELRRYSKGQTIIPELGFLITEGRKNHVCLIMGTQRPASIPLIAITESQYFAVFKLLKVTDRQRMGDEVNPEFYIPPPGRHDFKFWKIGMDKAILIKQG